MNSSFLKDYKSLIIGAIITIVMTFVLIQAGLFIINPDYFSTPVYVSINFLFIVFCWWVLSFLINKFPLYQTLGVLSLLIGAMLAERYIDIPLNPITLPLLILFWLGLTYLIVPEFFKKYKIAILSVYGVALSYFFIFRMTPNYIEEHHQNFINLQLFPIPVFAALWVYEQWRWLKMLQENKAKTELTLLKNQINPHFFFNTLNNLYGLAVEKSDKAPAMILKLSDIMRYTIYEGNADFVSLTKEVTYLEDYIELHKIRYQKKVDISLHKDLQHSHQIAPILLLVPLENAFKHGVESLSGQAFIDVSIRTTPSSISFRMSNNYEPNEKEGEGIGLANLKKRLTLIYPNQHQLKISQTATTYTISLDIESHEVPDHR